MRESWIHRRSFLRDNGLSVFFGVLFLLALVGQAFAGWHDYNSEQQAEGEPGLSFGGYVSSVDFAVAVSENWQSEYLQFLLFVLATVWFVQRGSPESGALDEPGLEDDEKQKLGEHAEPDSPAWARAGGWRTTMFSWSLTIAMAIIFAVSWLAQSLAGWVSYNQDQVTHEQPRISWASYLVNADFWERTLQNWQSEFLAVGSFVALTIYLRQRGSSESKPVGDPHAATGTSG